MWVCVQLVDSKYLVEVIYEFTNTYIYIYLINLASLRLDYGL